MIVTDSNRAASSNGHDTTPRSQRTVDRNTPRTRDGNARSNTVYGSPKPTITSPGTKSTGRTRTKPFEDAPTSPLVTPSNDSATGIGSRRSLPSPDGCPRRGESTQPKVERCSSGSRAASISLENDLVGDGVTTGAVMTTTHSNDEARTGEEQQHPRSAHPTPATNPADDTWPASSSPSTPQHRTRPSTPERSGDHHARPACNTRRQPHNRSTSHPS